jgi:glycosyltransferase involved in cell wall biosynthesis
MRICFVNDYFLKDPTATITGPMVQTYLLGEGLAKRGWNVDYVATTHSNRAGTTENHGGIQVRYLKADRWEFGSAWRIQKELSAVRADVFYQRGRSMLTYLASKAARRCRGRFIWASSGEGGCRRGKYMRQQLGKKKGLKRMIYRPIYALADRAYEAGIESADVVLVQTDFQRKELETEFNRNATIFRSGQPVPPVSVLEKPQPPVVLWIGALKPAKQPEMFLELAESCSQLDARFLMVGRADDARWRSRLTEVAKRSAKFCYRDEVPFEQVSPVFAEASVLLNTTVADYEGLPNAFIQAWLHGVPVVSLHADPDGLLGLEGIGFCAHTFEGLLERTKYLLLRPEERERMGKKARVLAEKEFGLDDILSRFERVAAGS